MNWRLSFVVLASLLVPFSWAAAQEKATPKVIEQTKQLQQNLREWHETLDSMDFAALKLDQHWMERLSQERAMCVEGIETADAAITAQLEEKQPSLLKEVVLFGVLSRLEVNLMSLLDFLNLSYYVHQGDSASQEAPRASVELQGKVSGMMSGLEIAYEHIQVDVVDQLVVVDKSPVARVAAAVSSQRP